jgi:RHS repeat-associated protein
MLAASPPSRTNGVDQVASITYPDKLSVSFTYDEAGNKRSVVYPGGLVVSYAYDDRNRVSSPWGAGSSFTRHYDPAGNLLKTVRSNGTESSYTYDRNDRVVHIVHRKGTDSFADMAYKRNARGNTIEEPTDLPLSHPLADAATAATYNDANQMTAWGDGACTYDAQGNMTTVTGAASMHVVYDVENRPLSMTRNGATTTYAYNGLGLRTQATSGSKTRPFHHDARGRLLFETDGDGNVTAWYIYSGISLTAMVTSTGETCYYHFDKTGNTLALTDGSGRVVSSYVYEPFGRIANQTGTVPNSFTYVGELGVMDEGSNLYFMMHRYYDAETERFIQKDPVGIAGGVNLYAYVVNNPVDRVDPSGLLGPEGSLSEQRFLDLATAPETRNAREAMGRTVLGVGEGLTTVPFTSYSLGRGVRRLAGHLLGIDTSVDENTWSYWTGNLAGQLGQMVACGGATAAYKSFDTGGKALCYTGSYGTSALALARLEALKTGAVLLEATPGGRLLNYVNSNLITVPDRIWEVASALYALNARSQGQLTVFIGSAAKEGQGIYYTTEKVILRRFGVALKEVFVH